MVRWTCRLIVLAAILALTRSAAEAQAFYEKWFLTTAGLAEGDNSFQDKWVGPDLLPYTEDDEPLPEAGNSGGTWTAAWLDVDGDGTFFGDVDHRFTLIRRGDDDMQSLGANSEFHHGVFSEGEDWSDFHNADNEGPCTDPATQGCNFGDDFEHNDGYSNWEDKDNWYWYNNAKANQRGLGGSRYYFEWKDAVANPGAFDEPQKWRKGLQLQRNYDNGQLPEKRCCVGHEVTIKGLLIPVSAMATLKDGELDPLFGGLEGDMAKYFRETIAPKLSDPALTVFEAATGCSSAKLPPDYVLLLQGQYKVEIKDTPNATTSASYYGIAPTGPVGASGLLPTDAMYHWSQFQILWRDTVNEPSTSPGVELVPADGVLKNLWTRDTFNRKEFPGDGAAPDDLGYLTLGCPPALDTCWNFVVDEVQDPNENIACASDHALYLPSGVDSNKAWAQLPITGVAALDATKGRVHAEVDLNIASPDSYVYIVLADGNQPVAQVDIKNGTKPNIGVGGRDMGMGLPLAPVAGATLGLVVSAPTDLGIFTTLDLVLDAKAKEVELIQDGSSVGKYSYAADGFAGTKVNTLRVWVENGSVYLDQMAILQEFSLQDEPVGTKFKRGNANGDADFDISDAVFTLASLFQGGPEPSCDKAADSNDDGSVDISDAVWSLSYLFQGGGAPPEPFAACGLDATADTLDCTAFAPCN